MACSLERRLRIPDAALGRLCRYLPVLVVAGLRRFRSQEFGRRTRLKHAQGCAARKHLASIAKLLTAITGIISALLPSWAGKARRPSSISSPRRRKRRRQSRFELIVKVATLLFIATLYLCLARLEWHSAQAWPI